jgi:hypothetical protein
VEYNKQLVISEIKTYCWKCDKQKEYFRLGCCRACFEFLKRTAENMYFYNTPYASTTCICGRRIHLMGGKEYCPDCRKRCCWRCGKKKLSDVISSCCIRCYAYLDHIAKNIYLHNTPYVLVTCTCGKKFRRGRGRRYCPDCDLQRRCWRCEEVNLVRGMGCCGPCYSRLQYFANCIYKHGIPYRPKQCIPLKRNLRCWRCNKQIERCILRCCQVCFNYMKDTANRIKNKEQLIWINLCFPKLCECGCGRKLIDTKRFIKHHVLYTSHNNRRGRKKHKIINTQGYVMIFRPDHPRAHTNGYIFEHILVMEEYLNRALTKDEIIHHIDRNRQNNDISNLLIVTSQTHPCVHASQRAKSHYTCSICQVLKPASNFHLTKYGTREYGPCKECNAIESNRRGMAWYKKNKKVISLRLAYNRKLKLSNQGREKVELA